MMKLLFVCLFAMVLFSTASSQRAFIHSTASTNSILYWSIMDNALMNGQSDAKLQLTKNWNPNGTAFASYNFNETGVAYLSDDYWAVYNENTTDILGNMSFNVYIPADGENSYTHNAEKTLRINTSKAPAPLLVLDHPLLNNRPEAMVFVTHNMNVFGNFQTDPVGVYYISTAWAIYNLDGVNMTPDQAFNVYIAQEGDNAFYHFATAENTGYNYTLIDHPDLNDNPNAILIVTRNLSPGGVPSGVLSPYPVGVWYSVAYGKWSIFNEDFSTMDIGNCFNVLIADQDNNNPLPDPWQTADVGTVNVTGAADYGDGAFLLSGSGVDIWGTSDAFRYVYQEFNEEEDIDFKIRVASLSKTDVWAKAGLMVRQSLDANSIFASTLVSAENGSHFQTRESAGASALSITGPNIDAPVWLRILKVQDTISGFISGDGESREKISSVELGLNGSYYAGLAVCSHNDTILSTAVFTDMTLAPPEEEDSEITGIETSGDNLKFAGPVIFPNPTKCLHTICLD
jgi:hypothetical protein